ncbi:MAG: chemotaxis protein CheW [Thermodesulfobacteriota bacterium]|nr:chemotaxis protein CheW [Thermodesulfobacteriota bacterium]
MENTEHIQDASLSVQYVTFDLGDEEYGIPILKLNEIIAYQKPIAIPKVPAFIKGVLNMRDLVVPVIDLRERFCMEKKEKDQMTVIMILDVSGRTMGMIVDSVNDVVTLNKDDIRNRPSFSTGIDMGFIEGMGVRDDTFIILLDVNRLFSDEELNIVDGV